MDTQPLVLKSLEPPVKIRRRQVASPQAYVINNAHTFRPSDSSLISIDPSNLGIPKDLTCVEHSELFVYSHEAKALIKFQNVSIYTPRVVRFEERYEAVPAKPCNKVATGLELSYPPDSDTMIVLHQWNSELVDIPSHIRQLYMIRSTPQFRAHAIANLTHMALLDLTELMAFPTRTLEHLFVACYSGSGEMRELGDRRTDDTESLATDSKGSVKLPQGCRVYIHTAFRDVMERDDVAAEHYLFNYGEDTISDEHLVSNKYETCGDQIVIEAFGRQFRVVQRVMLAVGVQ